MRFSNGVWVTKRIEDICQVVSGGTPDTQNKKFWGGEIKWYTPSEIGKNKYVNKSERTITKEGLAKSSAKMLPEGTVLLSTRATVGESSISLTPCCTNQGFQSLIAKSGISNEFIYYLLQTKKKVLNKKASGSTFIEISNKEVMKIRVEIPIYSEQLEIARFLSAIDERIEVQNKIINNLLSLKKTINNVLFEAYSPSIIFKECYLKAKEGGTPDTNNKLFYEHGTIPFAKIDDLSGKYIASTKSYISEKGLVKSSAWLIPAQSVLLSNGATIGECSITQCVLCTKQGIVGIIPSEIITSDFMYYFFKTNKFRKLIVRITTRGTMETAYIKDIEKIRISLPKKDEQIRHAKIMNSFEHKIDNEKRILEHLLTQKKFFLNNLFI